MFGKLKNKLKEWTKKVAEVEEENEEVRETPEEEIKEESDFVTEQEDKKLREEAKEEKKGFLKKVFSKKEKSNKETSEGVEENKLPTDQELKEEVKKEKYIEPEKEFIVGQEAVLPNIEKTKEKLEEPKQEKKKKSNSIFSKKKIITDSEFEEYAMDLELILLENNVALEVTDKILSELKEKIVGEEMNKKEIIATITQTLKEIIEEVLIEPFDLIKEIKEKEEPYVMIFCGINGVGKTTQIAKFAHMLKEKGLTSVMAAGDTFRAAAVEQIKEHGQKLDIKVISHDYGSDPASVGFDAIKYAQKNKIDVVLIDTAGRIHTATNLLKEMEKIKRVCKPDRTIFVGESITGNDAVDQVKAFNETIGIDAIFLSKADIDEKGGTALSVGYVTKKPIIYLGTGQNYGDIEPFDKKAFIKKLDLDEI